MELTTSERVRKAYSRLRKVPGIGSVLAAATHSVLPDKRPYEVRGFTLIAPRGVDADFLRGDHEPDVEIALRSALTPESTFYDVGAGIGYFSLMFAPMVNQVFSFEPDPLNASLIRASVEANGYTNVTVVEAAVTDTSGTASFDSFPGSLTGHIAESGPEVRAVRLDEFHASPAVVKVDVEGAGVGVIEGAGLFADARWVIEYHSDAERIPLLRRFPNAVCHDEGERGWMSA